MKIIQIICICIVFCFSNTVAQISTTKIARSARKPTVDESIFTRSRIVDVSSKNSEADSLTSSVTATGNTKTSVENLANENANRYASKEAPVHIPHFDAPPGIDGQINKSEWSSAIVFGEFLQIQPGDNVAPSAETEVLMGYDEKNLYIAFRVKQNRSTVRASLARRDQVFNDDYVGVYLDTFDDKRRAYTIFFNPLGVQADGTLTEGRGEDYSVDLILESKGVLTPDGYTIEAAIPFKSLRYEAGENKLWGIHLFRRVKHNNNELDSWMPIDRNRSGTLNQTGHITGLENISTTRQLEIIPSITLSQSSRRVRSVPPSQLVPNAIDSGRFVDEDVKGELGLTAKFSLTPTTTLDFAINPDFAQVEADATVITANQRFPIFYPEKRPFFLERIDVFQTRMNVVNTRAIVDPDVAAKFTGKRGRNTFGILYASDNAPGNYSLDERENLRDCQKRRLADSSIVCNIERFVDKNADIGVFRLKRDIGKENNLGFFATTYNFIERRNNTGGFDGRFRLNPKMSAEFQLTGTTSRRFFYDPNLDENIYRTGNGFGYSYMIDRTERNLILQLSGVGFTRDYRADVGFTTRTDTNQHRSFVRYQTEQEPEERIIFKRFSNESAASHNWQGQMQNWNSNTQQMFALQRQTYLGGGVKFGYERVFEHEFGANRTATRRGAFFGADPERSAYRREVYGFVETTPIKQFYGYLILSYGKGQLDYDLGAGPKYPRISPAALLDSQNPFDPGSGNQLFIESNLRYQPTAALQVSLNYNKQRLVREDTNLTAFDDNVFNFRSTFQFTRNTFARTRIDYSTVSTRLRPQFLFGWSPNPGTAFYAGYNDDLNRNGYNPFSGRYESGLRQNERTFFIKTSYLFRNSF